MQIVCFSLLDFHTTDIKILQLLLSSLKLYLVTILTEKVTPCSISKSIFFQGISDLSYPVQTYNYNILSQPRLLTSFSRIYLIWELSHPSFLPIFQVAIFLKRIILCSENQISTSLDASEINQIMQYYCTKLLIAKSSSICTRMCKFCECGR